MVVGGQKFHYYKESLSHKYYHTGGAFACCCLTRKNVFFSFLSLSKKFEGQKFTCGSIKTVNIIDQKSHYFFSPRVFFLNNDLQVSRHSFHVKVALVDDWLQNTHQTNLFSAFSRRL